MTETARTEGRQPSTGELRQYREDVREAYEALNWTHQRLQRGVVPDAERDALVTEWNAAGQEELIRLIGWKAQRLVEEEERLVEHGNRAAFDPLHIVEMVIVGLQARVAPTPKETTAELVYATQEMRRSAHPTRV